MPSRPGFSPIFLLADYEPIERPIILGRNSWEETVFALPFLGRIYINKFLFGNPSRIAATCSHITMALTDDADPWHEARSVGNPVFAGQRRHGRGLPRSRHAAGT